jgi:hypothetical protein
MGAASEKIVQFRVLDIGPSPVPPESASCTAKVVLTYDNLTNGHRQQIALSMPQNMRYRDALAQAKRSGRVYWVDWNLDWTPKSAIPPGSKVQRLLDAVRDGQLSSPRGPEPSRRVKGR